MFSVKFPFGFKLNLARSQHQDVRPRTATDPVGAKDPLELYKYRRRDLLKDFYEPNMDRRRRLRLYEDMDATDIAAAVLDVYADDVCSMNPDTGRTIWVDCEHEPIREEIEQMLISVDAEPGAQERIRSVCKYGDGIERLVFEPGMGVMGNVWVDPKRIVVILDPETRILVGFREERKEYLTPQGMKLRQSYPWDYVQFKLRARDRASEYGDSVLFPGIRPWRQIVLGEDHALMYRLQRSPDRLIYMIDTGTASPIDQMRILNRWRKRIKKWEFLDPASQKYDNRFNPLTPLEDIFVAKRGAEDTTSIVPMQGSVNHNDVTDLLYYVQKFFTGVHIPPSFLGYNGIVGSSKSAGGGGGFMAGADKSLQYQSILYAHAIKAVQQAMCDGYKRMAHIHLMMKTYDPENLVLDWRVPGQDFSIKMSTPIALDDVQRVDVETMRWGLVNTMLTMGIEAGSFDMLNFTMFALKKVMHMSDEEASKLVQKPEMQDYKAREGDLSKEDKEVAKVVISQMRPIIDSIHEGIEDRRAGLLETAAVGAEASGGNGNGQF